MTSSAMFRNEGLSTLDDRFDQIEREYEDSDSDEEESELDSDDPDAPPTPGKHDLDAILNSFLNDYEILGNKLKPVLPGATPMEKLTTLRHEIAKIGDDDGEEEARVELKRRVLEAVDREERRERGRKGKVESEFFREEIEPKDRWDCESILSTYSNVSNHPRVIRMRDALGSTTSVNAKPRKEKKKIGIDWKTGFPVVDGEIVGLRKQPEEEEDAGDASDDTAAPAKEVIKRDRAETAEEKKARKALIKVDRAARRQTKKVTQEAFAGERKKQQRQAGKAAARRAEDVAGPEGGRGVGVMALS